VIRVSTYPSIERPVRCVRWGFCPRSLCDDARGVPCAFSQAMTDLTWACTFCRSIQHSCFKRHPNRVVKLKVPFVLGGLYPHAMCQLGTGNPIHWRGFLHQHILSCPETEVKLFLAEVRLLGGGPFPLVGTRMFFVTQQCPCLTPFRVCTGVAASVCTGMCDEVAAVTGGCCFITIFHCRWG
jgi:hypothetical protein